MSGKTTRTEAIAFHQMGTLMAVCFHVIPKAVWAEKNYGDLQSQKTGLARWDQQKDWGILWISPIFRSSLWNFVVEISWVHAEGGLILGAPSRCQRGYKSMDTTSQERTACRLGTGGGPSFMVPLGLWDSSISKSYGSYGNFHGFFCWSFYFWEHVIRWFCWLEILTGCVWGFFELRDFICKLGHGR